MKISTRARYGTKALLELALHENGELVPLKEISRRQQIPLPYLGHIISPLVRAGIVRSTRGVGGGVSLLKPPQQVVLIEVIELFEGPISLVDCVNHPESCPRSGHCVTRGLWCEVREAIIGVFESVTLQDLVERQGREDEP